MTTPRTLDELKAVQGDEQRVHAAALYLQRVNDAATAARHVRDQAISHLIRRHGSSETARRTGLSLATIKTIKRAMVQAASPSATAGDRRKQ